MWFKVLQGKTRNKSISPQKLLECAVPPWPFLFTSNIKPVPFVPTTHFPMVHNYKFYFDRIPHMSHQSNHDLNPVGGGGRPRTKLSQKGQKQRRIKDKTKIGNPNLSMHKLKILLIIKTEVTNKKREMVHTTTIDPTTIPGRLSTNQSEGDSSEGGKLVCWCSTQRSREGFHRSAIITLRRPTEFWEPRKRKISKSPPQSSSGVRQVATSPWGCRYQVKTQ